MQIKRDPVPSGNNVATIRLSGGMVAIVDREDFETLSAFYWRAKKSHNCTYAARRKVTNGKATTILMHRQITKCAKGFVVHHRNHDTLDNRKCNLEIMETEKHESYHRGGYI